MLNRKANLYAVLLIALAACTKQEITPINQSVEASSVDQLWWPGKTLFFNAGEQTEFGLTQEQTPDQTTQEGIDETIAKMNKENLKLTRVPIVLSESFSSKTIDTFLSAGYNVQILVNWNGDHNGERQFPTASELDKFKSQVTALFQYYQPYKDQIPYIAFENEWDWQIIHDANEQDLLTELAIVTEIGHQYGFKITDGGITGTGIRRWTYSQLSGDEAQEWLNTYWIGLDSGRKYYDYNDLLNLVNTYIAGVKNIGLDYSNVHWSNDTTCGNGFGIAAEKFRTACNISETVCNEFHISTDSLELFSATVNEIRGNAKSAIAYSGTNTEDRSIYLTDAMLDELK